MTGGPPGNDVQAVSRLSRRRLGTARLFTVVRFLLGGALMAAGTGCVYRTPGGDLARGRSAILRHLPIRLHCPQTLPSQVTLSECPSDKGILEVTTSESGNWAAELRQAEGVPDCTVVRVSDTEDPGKPVAEFWIEGGRRAGSAPRLLFAARLNGGRCVLQTSDVRVSFAGGPLAKLDEEATACWAPDHVEVLTDVGFIMKLSDILWHNQALDRPPGSFNDIIRLHYRVLELDPTAVDVTTTTAWLLWSKWVTWKRDPEAMPDGKTKLREALALLEQGSTQNAGNARYAYEAARILTPVARFHRKDLTQTVLHYLKTAHRLETDPRRLVRIRLDIAHQYRLGGNRKKAREWYRDVLKLDPKQRVALSYLDKLQ